MESHCICVRFFSLCNPAFISKVRPMYCKMDDGLYHNHNVVILRHLYSVWDRVCPLLQECSEFWMVWMFCVLLCLLVSFSHGSELCTEAAFKRHRAENSSAFRALQHQRATRPLCSSLHTQLYKSVRSCVRACGACVTADPATRLCWHAALRLTWACVAQRRRVGRWSHGDGNSSRNEFELRERLRLGRTCNGKTRVVMLFSFLTSVGSISWSEVNTWATTSAPVSAHSAQRLFPI